VTLDDEQFVKAIDLWESFKEELVYRNRFIVNHEILEYLKLFSQKNQLYLDKDKILYRARIYTGDLDYIKYINSDFNCEQLGEADHIRMLQGKHNIDSRRVNGFWGYGKDDSFVPTDNDCISDGRTNPAFIKYLYTAEDPYTALVEVRPYLESKVSVAEILINEPISVADFSYDTYENFEGFEQILILIIMHDFSKPNNSKSKNYIATQYIAEFIKSLGFGGIKFNSSLYKIGRNITIFSYDKCQPVSSRLYEIEDICFETKVIAPKDQRNLAHYKLNKLREYQKKEAKPLLKNPFI